MENIKDFKDLILWQRAMDLVVEVYQLVKKLPKEWDIFRLSMFNKALCIQYLAKIWWLQLSDCAISFS